jgi:hypothetical protein
MRRLLYDDMEFYNAAFEQVNLISLETLTLEKCHDLDSKGFKALMKGITKLQHLKLSYLYLMSKLKATQIYLQNAISSILKPFEPSNVLAFLHVMWMFSSRHARS